MADRLDADAEAVPSVRHQLVLLDGRTFAISDEAGQMRAPTHGLVHDDLRHLSRLDGRRSKAAPSRSSPRARPPRCRR